MHQVMSMIRDSFYKKRKRLFFTIDRYNRLNKPDWMTEYNISTYESIYENQRMIFKEGRVVLASLVQANSLLFNEGENNHPAVMIYSDDLYFEKHPLELVEIASNLYNIKGKKGYEEDVQVFADHLANEVETLFSYKIPEKLTKGKEVFYTSFMVHREHLPNKCIDFRLFPAVVLPEKTEGTMILPSRYWEDGFHEYLQFLTS